MNELPKSCFYHSAQPPTSIHNQAENRETSLQSGYLALQLDGLDVFFLLKLLSMSHMPL